MLKKFFTVLLGSMAAIWLSVILLTILFFVMIGSMAAGLFSEAGAPGVVEDKTVLVIDLTGDIAEREAAGSLKSELLNDEEISGTLEEYIAAIDEARSDDRIKGILIKCGGAAMGTASREELIEALRRFGDRKFIIAYADSYSQGDYYVACSADELYLNPVGNLDLHGIAAQTPFFTGLLDKIGVKMQIVKVGKFKSAVEPFILKSASEPSIQQTQTYINGLWNEVTSFISDRRGIGADTIKAYATDIASMYPTEKLVTDSLVDRLAYYREVVEILKKRVGLKADDDLRTVTPADYLIAANKDKSNNKHIAVYYATGDIVDSGSDGISASAVVPDIISLADNENVAGLILRVNSGGGSAFASEQIWEAIEYFKSKDKPVYASMSDVAASGGYYISCGADRIYADATTLTGSIGIFGMIPCLEGLVTDKLGVTFTTVQTNKNADFINVMAPMSAEQTDAMQRMVEHGYETFVSRVAAGRGLSIDSVKVIGEGRVWYGRDALRIGLVDTLASLHSAKTDMAAALHIDANDVVNYPEIEYPMFVKMLRMMQADAKMSTSIVAALASQGITLDRTGHRIVARLSEILSQLQSGATIQARMEDIDIQ